MSRCGRLYEERYQLWGTPSPLSIDQNKIAYDQMVVIDTKISPMTWGLVVRLQIFSPAAQGKMKMTWKKIAYDQRVCQKNLPKCVIDKGEVGRDKMPHCSS